MPDNTNTYNFRADVSNFMQGMRTISSGFDSIANKSSSAISIMTNRLATLTPFVTAAKNSMERFGNIAGSSTDRMKQAMIGLSPAITAVKNSSASLVSNFSKAGLTMGTSINSAATSSQRLNTSVNSLSGTVSKVFPKMSMDLTKLDKSLTSIAASSGTFAVQFNKATADIIALGSKSTDALKKLEAQMVKGGTSGSNAATKMHKSYNTLDGVLHKLYMTALKVATIFAASGLLAKGAIASMDYIETINLFQVSMGAAADEAEAFINKMSGVLGLDPVELMRMSGLFNVLSKSIGVGSVNANIMSQGLTQLAVDIASLYNMKVVDVQSKLNSGLVGYSRAVRDVGIDISLNALAREAELLGLKINVRTLDQASKMQLRYSAMLRQTRIAQGDFARTASQPANQLRILGEQLTIAARELGNIFLPAIAAVLPWLIALARLASEAFRALAMLFGFGDIMKTAKDNAQKAAGGIVNYGDEVDDLGDSAVDTGKKLEALTNIQGFDELNILDSPKAGTGAGAGGAGGATSIDLPLETYDMGLSNVIQKADEIVAKLKLMWEEFKKTETYARGMQFLSDAWDALKAAVGWAWQAIKDTYAFIKDNWNWLEPIAIGIGAAIIAIEGLNVINTIVGAVIALLSSTTLGIPAIPLIILGAAIGLGFAVIKLTNPLYKINDAMDDQIDKIKPWKDAYDKAVGHIGDVNLIVGAHGETLATITSQIDETEAAITEVYKNALKNNKYLQDEDIKAIETYLKKLADLNIQKLNIYVLNAEATVTQIETEMRLNKKLTKTELAELQKSLDNANAELKTARDAAERSEIQQITTLYNNKNKLTDTYFKDNREVKGYIKQYSDGGSLSQANYNETIALTWKKYNNMEKISNDAQGRTTSHIIAYNADTARLEKDGYQVMADTQATYEQTYRTNAARIKEIDSMAYWDQVANSTERAKLVRAQVEISKAAASDFLNNQDKLQIGLDSDYLTQIAHSVTNGAVLTQQEQRNVSAILGAWDVFSPNLNSAGKAGLIALAQGLGASLPSASVLATMTSNDLIAVINTALGVNPNGGGGKLFDSGQGLMTGLGQGISSGQSGLNSTLWTSADAAINYYKAMYGINSSGGYSTTFYGIGASLMEGMKQGALSRQADLNKTWDSIALNAIHRTKNVLQVKSPSKVFNDIGANLMKGMAIGIKDYAYLVENALDTTQTYSLMQPNVAVKPATSPSGISSSPQSWADSIVSRLSANKQSASSGNISVHVGNEELSSFIVRSNDRQSLRSNGR